MENISMRQSPSIPIQQSKEFPSKEFPILSDPGIKKWMEENNHLRPVEVNEFWQTEYRL
jgi:hypothetical protein